MPRLPVWKENTGQFQTAAVQRQARRRRRRRESNQSRRERRRIHWLHERPTIDGSTSDALRCTHTEQTKGDSIKSYSEVIVHNAPLQTLIEHNSDDLLRSFTASLRNM